MGAHRRLSLLDEAKAESMRMPDLHELEYFEQVLDRLVENTERRVRRFGNFVDAHEDVLDIMLAGRVASPSGLADALVSSFSSYLVDWQRTAEGTREYNSAVLASTMADASEAPNKPSMQPLGDEVTSRSIKRRLQVLLRGLAERLRLVSSAIDHSTRLEAEEMFEALILVPEAADWRQFVEDYRRISGRLDSMVMAGD